MVNRLFLIISILLIQSSIFQSLDLTNIVDEVNALQSGWTAAVNADIDLADDGALRRKLGAAVDPNAAQNVQQGIVPTLLSSLTGGKRLLAASTYPAALDLRTKYPACKSISSARSQGQCGSCWAFASMNSLSDRYCIANYNSGKPVQRSFSPQDALECCADCASTPNAPCNGGFIAQAFNFAYASGVSTGEEYGNSAQCKPYFLSASSATYNEPTCKSACANSAKYATPLAKDRVKIRGYRTGSGEAAMIAALNNGGSIAVTFTVYKDLYSYQSGVYKHVAGADLGLHAVRIVGYGTQGSTNFWIAANTWGSGWGEKGFFRIARGTNECGIESSSFAYGNI